eukprot:Clim_evm10s42 gene=Clim_evmTU10s42
MSTETAKTTIRNALRWRMAIVNKNPRSAYLLGSAPRPVTGYYHRLTVDETGGALIARVWNQNGHEICNAHTNEYDIEKHLYSTTNISAARNLGTIMVARMKRMGIERAWFDVQNKRFHGKVAHFVNTVRHNGILIRELS